VNVTQLEDIAEIQIIRGNKSESEVNSQLDQGWELIKILSIKDQLTFILGKREEDEELEESTNTDSSTITV